ncbi:hypothetical protein ACFX13_040599 [Malus domestica]
MVLLLLSSSPGHIGKFLRADTFYLLVCLLLSHMSPPHKTNVRKPSYQRMHDWLLMLVLVVVLTFVRTELVSLVWQQLK